MTLMTTKKPLAAFCENCHILDEGNIYYRVKTLEKLAVIKKVKKCVIDCPDCDHALFWSNEYDLIRI